MVVLHQEGSATNRASQPSLSTGEQFSVMSQYHSNLPNFLVTKQLRLLLINQSINVIISVKMLKLLFEGFKNEERKDTQ